MRVQAIVPQKALAQAKSRLGSVLSAPERASLTLSLLRHVWATLRAVRDVDEVLIMTPDPEVASRARRWGARVAPDPAPTLNASLAEMIRRSARDGRGTLIIAADLPYLRPEDVVALLASGGDGTAVLAPSAGALGTNALLLPPGAVLHPAYGPASLVAHRSRARASGLHVVEVIRPGLAFDLDTPADLGLWRGRGFLPGDR